MRFSPRVWFLSFALAVLPAAFGENTTHLLLDDRLIDHVENARLAVGTVHKSPANPLFREDKPWEVRVDNVYANIIYDPEAQLYRCWYSPFIVDTLASSIPHDQRTEQNYHAKTEREMGLCYATSRDGLVWEKPELGLVEFNGSKANNLLVREIHGAGIMRDPHDPDPARRYKAFFQGMGVRFSADGIHWSDKIACPEVVARGDTHNQAFWGEEQHQYVGITRLFDGQRIVGRTTSPDFVHWTPAVEVLRGDKLKQTYAMCVFPAGDVFLSLVMIFQKDTDRVHPELVWSPDTITWHRIDEGTPVIPLSEKPGDYDWGCIYAAVTPVVRDDEVRIYYGASNGKHTNWRDGFLALATLRPDGWAGYKAVDAAKPGVVVTKPQPIAAGDRLLVTADAEGGSLVMSILDGGKEIGHSKPLTKNVTRAAVEWVGADPLGGKEGRSVQVRFEVSGAAVYAFSLGK